LDALVDELNKKIAETSKSEVDQEQLKIIRKKAVEFEEKA